MIDLQIRQVSFAYDNGLVLDSINLSVKAGEMVALLGPNGSGKTTLIKLASGILKPKRGEIRLDGSNLSQLSRKPIGRSIAVMPQQFHHTFAFTHSHAAMLGRHPFSSALAG